MRKFLLLSLSVLLAFSVIGCSAKPSEEIPSASSETEQQPSEPAKESESSDVESQPMPPVADAAMYRGVVIDLQSNDKGTLVTLEQAKGTNFGAPTLKVQLDENTNFDFEPEKGAYLEVYYGRAMNQPLDADAIVTAISAARLRDVDMVNFNGIVKEIGSTKSGLYLMMTDLEGNENSLRQFHVSETDTKIYLNWDKLKVGDKLNIFTNGIMTMSLPPQSPTLEIRPFYEGV